MSKQPTKRLCPGFTGDSYQQAAHDLPLSAFYQNVSRRGGGYSQRCKACHRARASEYFRTRYYPQRRVQIIEAVTARRKNKESK